MAALLLQAISAPSVETARFPAPEARQGVAASGRFVYAIDNSTIGKYDLATESAWNAGGAIHGGSSI